MSSCCEETELSKYLGSVDTILNAVEKINEALGGNHGNTKYRLEKMHEFVRAFSSFAKFRLGDKIQLAHDIDATGGWADSKHYLIKGAFGTVRDVDFDDGEFNYDISFERESNIYEGKISRPSGSGHTYGLRERHLEPRTSEKDTAPCPDCGAASCCGGAKKDGPKHCD